MVFIVLDNVNAPYFFSSDRSSDRTFWFSYDTEGRSIIPYSIVDKQTSKYTFLLNLDTSGPDIIYFHYARTEDGLSEKNVAVSTTVTLPSIHNIYFPAMQDVSLTDLLGNDTPATSYNGTIYTDGPIGSYRRYSGVSNEVHSLGNNPTGSPYTIITLCKLDSTNSFKMGYAEWIYSYWYGETLMTSVYGSHVTFSNTQMGRYWGTGGSGYSSLYYNVSPAVNGWALASYHKLGTPAFTVTKSNGSYVESNGTGADGTATYRSGQTYSARFMSNSNGNISEGRIAFVFLCTDTLPPIWAKVMGASIFDTGLQSSFIYVDFQNSLLPPEASPPPPTIPLTTTPTYDVALVANLIQQSNINDVTFKTIIYNVGSYQNDWTVAGGSNVVNVWGYFEPMLTGTYVSDNDNTDANDGRFFTFKEYMFQMHDKLTIRGIKYDVQAIQDRYIADNQIYKMLILKKQPIYYAACKGTVI